MIIVISGRIKYLQKEYREKSKVLDYCLINHTAKRFSSLLLTITMAPFFVGVYYLINEAMKPQYKILILNQDKGFQVQSQKVNYSLDLIKKAVFLLNNKSQLPVFMAIEKDRNEAIKKLKNKKADALIVFPENFSQQIYRRRDQNKKEKIDIQLWGDLTHINYMISAIWADEVLNEYIYQELKETRPFCVKEISLGTSGQINDFDLYVPGLLILSIIMLMFPATLAIVNEVENKTIMRLKLSKISTLEFLSGVSFVQVLIGFISILLTLGVAVSLGFNFAGSFWLLILLAILTSISIIAFSLIIAAFTKNANEVLIVGNFPLLLFMFFTGAAFPMKSKVLFSIAEYPISWQSFMSPTHAIDALKKVAIMKMNVFDILPEIFALMAITILYFLIGILIFQKRHLKIR